jgi:Arc/MetJ family transcription regulator
LIHVHEEYIMICLRTTLILDDSLMDEARTLKGIREKTALVHEGLRALITRVSARRLRNLGGSDPSASAGDRQRRRSAV